ncbi:MAG: TrmH family RNA methyltransferase [Victivallales bacterium]|nr:TrmH family RNA methyltransferase [Victivallales bacterium]
MSSYEKPPRTVIVLDRLRSAHNTGNIFRLAEAVGAAEIIACGYTPAPPHPKLAKTAMGTDAMVPCRSFPSSLEAVAQLRREGFRQILAVESMPDAPAAWDFPYQFPLALVFGNEALGVAPETLAACDGVVALPMFGNKASINVGNCAAVVLYAVVARAGLPGGINGETMGK